MQCKFRMLVFQDGKFDEEVETRTHQFANGLELATEMVKFVAMNNELRTHPFVRHIARIRTRIHEPRIRKGLGPNTCLVIKEVISIE